MIPSPSPQWGVSPCSAQPLLSPLATWHLLLSTLGPLLLDVRARSGRMPRLIQALGLVCGRAGGLRGQGGQKTPLLDMGVGTNAGAGGCSK